MQIIKREVVSHEQSVFAKLLKAPEPSMLIFGPSKAGKSHLAVWEACALASGLNRNLSIIITEPNIESSDIQDYLHACAYFNVRCDINPIDELETLSYFIQKLERHAKKAIRENQINNISRVYVLDSISAIANSAIASLSPSIKEAGTQSILQYGYPYIFSVAFPLRKIIKDYYLNGYLIMTSEEGGTRGENYTSGINVKAKPKYVNPVKYDDDAEFYITAEGNAFPQLLTNDEVKNNKKIYRGLVVVTDRRNPDDIGNAVAMRFIKIGEQAPPRSRKKKQEQEQQEAEIKKEIRRGIITRDDNDYGSVFSYIPEDMLDDKNSAEEIEIHPLMPVIGSGPKNIRE